MYVLFKLCAASFSLHSHLLTAGIRQKRWLFFLIRPNYHSTSPELFPVLFSSVYVFAFCTMVVILEATNVLSESPFTVASQHVSPYNGRLLRPSCKPAELVSRFTGYMPHAEFCWYSKNHLLKSMTRIHFLLHPLSQKGDGISPSPAELLTESIIAFLWFSETNLALIQQSSKHLLHCIGILSRYCSASS